MTTDLQPTVDASTVERVLLDGDLAKLTPAQRVSYYTRVCDSVGLNPLTRPFEYITLNGKLTLYARREASEQLRRRNHVSITITARELLEGETYVVTARATLPDNRCDESIGVKSLKGLTGESRANAMMTAETKSKRRVTLSICGLGLLDETEIVDIPDVAKPALSGYATLPAPPPMPATYEANGHPQPPPPMPEGFVLIERIDSAPTKNPKVLRYRVTLSTGEVAATINPMLASLAENCCQERIPVRVKLEQTRWGPELKSITREKDLELEPEELPLDEIPFKEATMIANFADAGKMTEVEYRQKREAIRATYGDTATERTGSFDQELARLFYQSGWNLEDIAKIESKSIKWVDFRARFGRFLQFCTTVQILKSLTERRFRGYWERTDKDEDNERIRFKAVQKLMDAQVILSRPIQHRPAIATAIKATSAGGDWHRLATIISNVQDVEKEATDDDVKAVLKSMGDGAYNVFCEKKKGAEVYRIVIGGKQKIDLVTLKHELGPIIAGLKAEGRKNMATMSPGTVAHLTFRLEQLLDKLAHLAPDESAGSKE